MIWIIFQKARLARIRIAKASSSAAFVNKKKAAEARLAAIKQQKLMQQSNDDIEYDDTICDDDIFELQHHHLLRCLEKTTVSLESETKDITISHIIQNNIHVKDLHKEVYMVYIENCSSSRIMQI